MTNDAVFNLLPEEELLAQLAEECSEAAKAALKLRRARDGVNPTSVSEEEAFGTSLRSLPTSTFAPSYCSAVSWTMMTPAICATMSETTWSRLWSRSSPAGSTV